MKRQNIDITLVNMGGIETAKDIPVFLFNMFNDEFILPLKQPLRLILAMFITIIRAKETYKILNSKPSPIIKITKKQAERLSSIIGEKVNYAFIYSKPYLRKKTYAIPMYNFYSHTTQGQILKKAAKANPPFCIYKEFFDLVCSRIEKAIKKLNPKKTAIILSAHSIPEKHSKKDSYKEDLEVFLRYLRKRFKFKIILSFQSKVGPVKWLKPTTEKIINEISKEYENIVILPISFTSENTETVYEIDVTYKQLAKKNGIKKFVRIKCFNYDEDFIKFLAKILSH